MDEASVAQPQVAVKSYELLTLRHLHYTACLVCEEHRGALETLQILFRGKLTMNVISVLWTMLHNLRQPSWSSLQSVFTTDFSWNGCSCLLLLFIISRCSQTRTSLFCGEYTVAGTPDTPIIHVLPFCLPVSNSLHTTDMRNLNLYILKWNLQCWKLSWRSQWITMQISNSFCSCCRDRMPAGILGNHTNNLYRFTLGKSS